MARLSPPRHFLVSCREVHRTQPPSAVAAALIVLTLVVGIVGTTWEAVRASRERERAEKRFAQVRQLANNVLFKYYDEIEKLPGSTKAREMLVGDALEYLDGLAQDARDNTDLRRELAQAYLRIGKVQGRAYNANLGDTTGAIESYRKRVSLLEPIALASADTKLQSDLVGSYTELGTRLRRQGNTTEADAALRRALSLNEQFHAAHPEDMTLSVRLATIYVFLGDALPTARRGRKHRCLPAFAGRVGGRAAARARPRQGEQPSGRRARPCRDSPADACEKRGGG